MRVIITGGTGLIGRKLVATLIQDGYEVIVLSRRPEQVSGLPVGARAVGWDARSAQGWGDLADGAAAIVNLAGESIAGAGLIPERWTAARKQRIVQSRVDAAQAVTQAVAAAQVKPRVVVQASAVGYYGPSGDTVITESSPAGGDYLAQVGVAWEDAGRAIEAMGVRRVLVRLGLVLDADGGVLPRLALPFRLFAGGPLGSGRQWYPWIHVDDVVGAIQFLIENEQATGAVNLTAPNPVTNRDFATALGRALGRPALLPVPSFAFQAALGELATLILDGQRAIPQRLQELGYTFKFSEIEAALRDLL